MLTTGKEENKSKIEGMHSANVDMAQAKMELAIQKYKVVVERDAPIAEQKKRVRL